jgi:hypothetical protein
VTERPETPEGEHQTDETAITEPAALDELAPPAEPVPAPEPPALAPAPPPPPPVIPSPPLYEGDRPELAADRPELQIGAAFAGGFALALILKRLAR